MPKKIILASTSPRRKELFSKLGLPFKVEASDYEENMSLKMSPAKLAVFLSRGKALAVAKKHQAGIVIGADTFVVRGQRLLGKPENKIMAARMLRSISDKRVDILTGFTIIDITSGRKVSGTDRTKVYIKKLNPREIKNYIASAEPLDKAGAFAIQDLGAVIIKRIEGNFTGALGLPLYAIAQGLKKLGVNVL
jgi:septum formation protein